MRWVLKCEGAEPVTTGWGVRENDSLGFRPESWGRRWPRELKYRAAERAGLERRRDLGPVGWGCLWGVSVWGAHGGRSCRLGR